MNAQILVTGLLSLFFIFASSIKIFGWQKLIFETQREMFKSYGFNRQFMALIGFVEFFGAVTIWLNGTAVGTIGALAIAGTSAGAIFFHLVYDTWKDGIPATVTLILSTFLVWTNRGTLLDYLEVSVS